MINWKLPTRGQLPIGLDIGHNSIKMIQLEANAERIRVLGAESVHIDSSANAEDKQRRDFIVTALKQMLADGTFQGRNVVSSLPNGKLRIASVRMAEAEDDDIRRVLRKEVRQRFGTSGENDAVDYLIAGTVRLGDDVKNELILFTAEDQVIKDHIEMLEEAELRPTAVDTIPCALFRSFARSMRRHEDRERTTIFVDVGSRFTTLVFGRRDEIGFVKQIPIGGERFNQELASKLGITAGEAQTLRETLQEERMIETRRGGGGDAPSRQAKRGRLDASTRQMMIDAIGAVAEELAREISLCLRYYTVTFRGKRIERAVFAGGEAYEEILLNVLRRQLTVKIEVSEPLRGFDVTNFHVDNDGRGLFCEWAVAVGLGLRGLNRIADEQDGNERN